MADLNHRRFKVFANNIRESLDHGYLTVCVILTNGAGRVLSVTDLLTCRHSR